MNPEVTRPDGAAGMAGREGSRKLYDAFISDAHDARAAFAPALQLLAKPWNHRRAREVFRDESSLAVSPGRWPSIRAALDASRWFVLLASSQAARSHWAGEEISHRIRDNDSGDLSPAATAMSQERGGVFPTGPKHLDMTWTRRGTALRACLKTYVAYGATRRRQRLSRCCGASRSAPGTPGAIALPLPLSARRSR